MTLDEVPIRVPVTVSTLSMTVTQRHRLTELGVRHGVEVEVLRRAPFGGPLALCLPGGGLLALRRNQAAWILAAERGDGPGPAPGSEVLPGDGSRAGEQRGRAHG